MVHVEGLDAGYPRRVGPTLRKTPGSVSSAWATGSAAGSSCALDLLVAGIVLPSELPLQQLQPSWTQSP